MYDLSIYIYIYIHAVLGISSCNIFSVLLTEIHRWDLLLPDLLLFLNG